MSQRTFEKCAHFRRLRVDATIFNENGQRKTSQCNNIEVSAIRLVFFPVSSDLGRSLSFQTDTPGFDACKVTSRSHGNGKRSRHRAGCRRRRESPRQATVSDRASSVGNRYCVAGCLRRGTTPRRAPSAHGDSEFQRIAASGDAERTRGASTRREC